MASFPTNKLKIQLFDSHKYFFTNNNLNLNKNVFQIAQHNRIKNLELEKYFPMTYFDGLFEFIQKCVCLDLLGKPPFENAI